MIFAGTVLLMLPFSTTGARATWDEALFTAVSAVCVTGLVVQDTASFWSGFGQSVILILIQVGGLGVVTVSAAFALLSGRKITLMQRSTMQEALSVPKVGGIVRLTGFILRTTILIELVGAAVMMPVFYRDYGPRGIWMSVFHSISAFCNAGFDLTGTPDAPYVSLTGYTGNALINIVVMLLIVIGGIGFFTWEDVATKRFHLRRYRMQTKVILLSTAILIAVPSILFFLFEFQNLPVNERAFAAVFQSVTARTAGYNTADLRSMSEVGKLIMITLMMIGASPGSTAGGIKTTTVAILVANALATFSSKENVNLFGRRVDNGVVRSAATVLMMYTMLFMLGGLGISIIEGLPILTCMYETASAVGTVGLTLGVTPTLCIASRLILIMLMFWGRVGGLTLVFAALSGNRRTVSKLPLENITVG